MTVLKQRAPGMSLDRIPLFVWSMLVTSFIVIMAMPAIMIASTSLILDRLIDTHFFDPAHAVAAGPPGLPGVLVQRHRRT